jgi:hypothetical protein
MPYNWHLLVKPVLQDKCGSCHGAGRQKPDLSYKSLRPYAFFWPYWTPAGKHDVYVNGEVRASGSRTRPGRFGARESALVKGGYLSRSHYNVNLSAGELRRITLWLDMNSNELGAYTKVAAQRAGKMVWPEIDVDPNNPLGVEKRDVAPIIRPVAQTAPVGFAVNRSGGQTGITFPSRERYTVHVYDLSGNRVAARQTSPSGRLTLEAGRYRPGLYFVEAKAGGKTLRGKLLIW